MRTIEEVMDLRKRFEEHLEKAEQHEFQLLLMIDHKMLITIETIAQEGIENYPEEELESMFRVVERIIGGSEEC